MHGSVPEDKVDAGRVLAAVGQALLTTGGEGAGAGGWLRAQSAANAPLEARRGIVVPNPHGSHVGGDVVLAHQQRVAGAVRDALDRIGRHAVAAVGAEHAAVANVIVLAIVGEV